MRGLKSIIGATIFAVAFIASRGGGGEDRSPPAVKGPPVTMTRLANAPAEIRLRRRRDGHFYVHSMVNGQLVEFMIDTGATTIALTTRDAERVGLNVDFKNFTVIGTGASGAVEGQIDRLDSVEIEGRRATNLEAMVADGLDVSLLGQSFLGELTSVQMSGESMILR